MTNHRLVAIVLVNFNGSSDTLRCLQSLAHLDHPQHKIAVVDNASEDDSVARIRERHPDLQLIQSPGNDGFAAGCNLGMQAMADQAPAYYWLLNNDTVVESGSLSALVSHAEAHRELGAVGSVIYDLQVRDRVQCLGGGRVYRWSGHSRLNTGPGHRLDYVAGASLLLRADALEQVGLLDERYFFLWEDIDLGFRLRQAGWQLGLAEASRIWHAGGGTEAMLSDRRTFHHVRGLVLFMSSHAPVLLLPVLGILTYYLGLALGKLRPAMFAAAWRGLCAGWRCRRSPPEISA